MLRRQQVNGAMEDGVSDPQAGNSPDSTSKVNTPTYETCTPTSSTSQNPAQSPFTRSPGESSNVLLPSIDDNVDYQPLMQRVDEPSNGWGPAEFSPDDLGVFNLGI